MLAPSVMGANEGRDYWYLEWFLRLKLAGADTGGTFSLVEETGPRGAAPPPHVHGREDETILMLDGELDLTVGERQQRLAEGEIAFLPRGVPHGFEVVSETARFLLLVTPAGFEEFFLAQSVAAERPELPPAPEGPPDVERIVALCERFGVRLLGPPPG